MRRLIRTGSVVMVLMLTSLAVAAGGAVWHFEGYHQPGDVATSTTGVAWGHDPHLGRPEDGPYLIYLAPADASPQEWPGLPAGGLLVGIVEVYEAEHTFSGAEGPYLAVARFEIPQVPSGEYQVFHCNRPCTTTLGDVIGGWGLTIGGGGNGRSAEVIAAEVEARIPKAPLISPSPQAHPISLNPTAETVGDDASSVTIDGLWFWLVGLIGVLLVFRMMLSDPNRRLRSVNPASENQMEVLP